eukprot:TRINITY_DN441_c0_g1_i2.p1 TRINITY_DN441_c0_g1~~TRINITY_DN441_c0_g1_i2.p1  ORF type:complete len:208 (+),score=66.40 TRINITY_DN441_c0_g1_i2:198-821(+)
MASAPAEEVPPPPAPPAVKAEPEVTPEKSSSSGGSGPYFGKTGPEIADLAVRVAGVVVAAGIVVKLARGKKPKAIEDAIDEVDTKKAGEITKGVEAAEASVQEGVDSAKEEFKAITEEPKKEEEKKPSGGGFSLFNRTSKSSKPKAVKNAKRSVTVQPNDTLWSLAGKYNVSVDTIKTANSISEDDLIFAGSELIIPGSGLLGEFDD